MVHWTTLLALCQMLYSLAARCTNMSRPTRKAAKAHEERHLWIDCSQIMNHTPNPGVVSRPLRNHQLSSSVQCNSILSYIQKYGPFQTSVLSWNWKSKSQYGHIFGGRLKLHLFSCWCCSTSKLSSTFFGFSLAYYYPFVLHHSLDFITPDLLTFVVWISMIIPIC